MSIDDHFADRSANDRRIYDAVVRYVKTLGDVTIDVVSIGVLIKRARTFAELRPKRGGMSLAFLLSRAVEDDRIVRVLKTSAHRAAHFVDIATAREIDRDVKGWLAEAFRVVRCLTPVLGGVHACSDRGVDRRSDRTQRVCFVSERRAARRVDRRP